MDLVVTITLLAVVVCDVVVLLDILHSFSDSAKHSEVSGTTRV
jgi:hypothetical protein